MSAEAADDFTQLVVHALAHLSLRGPGNLHDPRYVQWAADALPEGAIEPVSRDAEVIGARYAAIPGAIGLHVLPDLHAGIDGFLASAEKPIEALTDADVDGPGTRRALLVLDRPLVELVRAAVALAAAAFRGAYDGVVAPAIDAARTDVDRALETARAVYPALAEERVELVHALGGNGRGLTDRILIGVPAAWNDVTAETVAVVAMHERAVGIASSRLPPDTADEERYVRAESAALFEIATALEDAPDPFRLAHAHWLAGLDLAPLLRAARALGVLPDPD